MFFCTKRIVSSLIYGDDIVQAIIQDAEKVTDYRFPFHLSRARTTKQNPKNKTDAMPPIRMNVSLGIRVVVKVSGV